MPKNSAHRGGGISTAPASRRRCVRAGTIRSASPGASAGSGPSVSAFVEDHLAQPRLVLETERGYDRTVRVHRVDQALSLQRCPDGGVAQAAGIACRYDCVAEMEMIAVRIGRAHGNARILS